MSLLSVGQIPKFLSKEVKGSYLHCAGGHFHLSQPTHKKSTLHADRTCLSPTHPGHIHFISWCMRLFLSGRQLFSAPETFFPNSFSWLKMQNVTFSGKLFWTPEAELDVSVLFTAELIISTFSIAFATLKCNRLEEFKSCSRLRIYWRGYQYLLFQYHQ